MLVAEVSSRKYVNNIVRHNSHRWTDLDFGFLFSKREYQHVLTFPNLLLQTEGHMVSSQIHMTFGPEDGGVYRCKEIWRADIYS